MYSLRQILEAVTRAEEYHYDKWGGKKHCPHFSTSHDLHNSLRRRLPRFLEEVQMQEMEYLVVNCLGDQNVVKALNEKTAEAPPWELHSIVPAGVKVVEANPLDPRQTPQAIMTFLVVFHRPYHNPNEVQA